MDENTTDATSNNTQVLLQLPVTSRQNLILAIPSTVAKTTTISIISQASPVN
jgi:hypothetical protein